MALDGLPTGFGQIIDAHTHVEEAAGLGWLDPPEKILAALDQAGVHRAVATTYTETRAAMTYLAEAVARYPDRLVGFVRIHPWHADALDLVREAVLEHGFKGVKMHPVTTIDHPASATSVAVLRAAAELGAPVLFHCGDEPMTTPLAIATAARQVPEATVILGHMGGYFHVGEAIAVAEALPNIVLETSAMPYPERIREAVDRVGAHRVLYGSDGPGCPPRLELAKVLRAGLEEAELTAVLRENVRALIEGVARP